MSDSESDMPQAVSFSMAKKTIISTQKDLKKATQFVVYKKNRVRRRNDLSEEDDHEERKKHQKLNNLNIYSEKAITRNKSSNNVPQALSAKVDQKLLSLINEELPTKKLKQLEGKFKVIEHQSSKNIKQESEKMIIQPEVHKARKELGEGIKVVFQKQIKQQTTINTSAINFQQNHLNLSSRKRQPISRIIGTK